MTKYVVAGTAGAREDKYFWNGLGFNRSRKFAKIFESLAEAERMTTRIIAFHHSGIPCGPRAA